jgi:hypothetical protein
VAGTLHVGTVQAGRALKPACGLCFIFLFSEYNQINANSKICTSLVESSLSSFCFCGFCFICMQVRILLLLATLTRTVSGRSRPMRVGFPTGTHRCRSSKVTHSLLGRRVCAYRERHHLYKTRIYLLKHLLELRLL